jgi:hypothetical protein
MSASGSPQHARDALVELVNQAALQIAGELAAARRVLGLVDE